MYEVYTKEFILNRMLENIPSAYDKEVGSVMFDLLSSNSKIFSELYSQIDNEIKNSFVTSADEGEGQEAPNLERIAYEKTFLLRGKSTSSNGLIRISSSKDIVLPKGTIVLRKDDLKYHLLEEIEIKANDIVYSLIECLENGSIGNCPSNFIDKLESPIEGVNVNNETPIINGNDIEDKEFFRQRVLNAIHNPPSSGNKAHYKKWLSEYEENGIKMIGSNKIIPRFDGLPYTIKIVLTDSNNLPVDDEFLNKVEFYIDNLKPEGALITYESAIKKEINISIKGTLREGIIDIIANEKIQNLINKYFYNIALIDGDKNVRINNIAGLLICSEIFLNISEIRLNGDIQDIEISDNEIPVLNDFSLEVV